MSSHWWKKHLDNKALLKDVLKNLFDLEAKIYNESWKKQQFILLYHSKNGSISSMTAPWRKRFWEISTESSNLSKKLIEESNEIMNYLLQM